MGGQAMKHFKITNTNLSIPPPQLLIPSLRKLYANFEYCNCKCPGLTCGGLNIVKPRSTVPWTETFGQLIPFCLLLLRYQTYSLAFTALIWQT